MARTRVGTGGEVTRRESLLRLKACVSAQFPVGGGRAILCRRPQGVAARVLGGGRNSRVFV